MSTGSEHNKCANCENQPNSTHPNLSSQQTERELSPFEIATSRRISPDWTKAIGAIAAIVSAIAAIVSAIAAILTV